MFGLFKKKPKQTLGIISQRLSRIHIECYDYLLDRYKVYEETHYVDGFYKIELNYFILAMISSLVKLKQYGGYNKDFIALLRDNFDWASAVTLIPLIPNADPSGEDENVDILHNNILDRFNDYADLVLKVFQSHGESDVQHNGYVLIASAENRMGIWRSDAELRLEALHIVTVLLDLSESVENAFSGRCGIVTKNRKNYAQKMHS